MESYRLKLAIGCAGIVLLTVLNVTGTFQPDKSEQRQVTDFSKVSELQKETIDGWLIPTEYISSYRSRRFGTLSLKPEPENKENLTAVEETISSQAVVAEVVSTPAVETEVIIPAPQPNSQILVAAAEPVEETKEPLQEQMKVPVISGVNPPGNSQVDEIVVFPSVEENPQPVTSEMPDFVESSGGLGNSDSQPVFSQTEQMASIQTGTTSIMGNSYTYLEQMVRYYKANKSYPSFYAGTDAPTIEDFCRIYIEEAKAEGVRVEVAFCQAMKETGYLTFGGDVDIKQFNFAGIGATGGGEPGNSFGNVRAGIRAQIQHLKAYASTDALRQQCIDPRFQYVNRGTTPYVEWLGIQENPNGGGWAAAKNYGPSIINDYIAKLFSY